MPAADVCLVPCSVKPANILLSQCVEPGQPVDATTLTFKLTDLGLALDQSAPQPTTFMCVHDPLVLTRLQSALLVCWVYVRIACCSPSSLVNWSYMLALHEPADTNTWQSGLHCSS